LPRIFEELHSTAICRGNFDSLRKETAGTTRLVLKAVLRSLCREMLTFADLYLRVLLIATGAQASDFKRHDLKPEKVRA
jgi:hypothetical protein